MTNIICEGNLLLFPDVRPVTCGKHINEMVVMKSFSTLTYESV